MHLEGAGDGQASLRRRPPLDGRALIELRGDIDGSAREALGTATSSAGASGVTLDFAAVDYIDPPASR